jgi:hypothetical protein
LELISYSYTLLLKSTAKICSKHMVEEQLLLIIVKDRI